MMLFIRIKSPGSDSDSDPEPDDSVNKSWYVTLGKCSDAHSVSL